MALLRINRQPSRFQLGVFAGAWFVMLGAAGIVQRVHGRTLLSEVLTAMAIVMPLLAWLAPSAVRWTFLALSYATYPIGFVVSYVVLGVVFYGVFTPIGVVMRLCGRDPLARRFDRAATSYWQPRPEPPPAESYLRQR